MKGKEGETNFVTDCVISLPVLTLPLQYVLLILLSGLLSAPAGSLV